MSAPGWLSLSWPFRVPDRSHEPILAHRCRGSSDLPADHVAMTTGVFIVDDSAFVRRALTRVLATEPEFRIVGEAASGLEALQKIHAADPDFVTLDVAMPGMD